ncbi:MAG TPA: CheR family methyltransferase [Sphingomonas sp.]
MEISEGAIRILAGLLEARTGQQLAVARRWRIEAALRPLLLSFAAPSLEMLAMRVVSGAEPRLTDAVIEALLNHETFFYRDMGSFELFADQGLGRLHAARRNERRLRIWSAGCSTGQEVYTLAMLIAGRPDRWAGWSIEILGTDLSAPAIARARAGRYSHLEIQRGLPIVQMLGCFEQRGEHWFVTDRLRAAVSFKIHNLVEPPPAGSFDVILCRNVLLYFSADIRRLVFGRLASAIAPDGLLMLGAGEIALGQTDQFVSDYACRGFYRRRIDRPEEIERAARR